SSANTFTVDTVAPAVSLTAPANGAWINTATPTFSGAAGTAAGDSSTVTVRVYGGSSATGTPVQTLTATATGSGWSVSPLSALADGQYTVQAEQGDAAGNQGFSSPATFTVDTTPPASFSNVAPADGSRFDDPTPTLQWTASSDSGS